MAHIVATDCYVSLGSAQSSHGTSVSLNLGDDLPDDTCFGDSFHQCLNGLQTCEAEFEFNNDFADNDLDEDLESLRGTQFAVAIRPVNTTIAATNPEYQFTGAASSVERTFEVGEVGKVKVSVKLASGTFTRDVTP